MDDASLYPSPLTPLWRQQFRRRMLAWFRGHVRDLPWRRTRDPYQVWVSEIMLQQTQVATVVPYFERFVAAFPDIQALAESPEQAVLRHWEGLGYYRRARQMHRAARVIVDEHGGQFPRDPDVVRRLPGIGRYTAGAILSIAFDLRQPIVEANTLRLYCRLLAWPGDPRSAEGQRLLWSTAEALLPRRGAGVLNQALMELGATVCSRRAPQCNRCPVEALCPTRLHSMQAQIPRVTAKLPSEAVREAAIIVERQGKVLLLRRGEGQRWAGLWDFPRFAVVAEGDAAERREIRHKLRAATGVRVGALAKLTTIKHGVTRFRITLSCFSARYLSGLRANGHDLNAKWVNLGELDVYPLSVTGRKLGRLVSEPEFFIQPRKTRKTRKQAI